MRIKKQIKQGTKFTLLWSIMMILLFSFSGRGFAAENRIDAMNDIQQQGRVVTGNITDISGEPLIGVTVIEAGTTNGVVTNFDGDFSITLTTPNPQLNISYIGYTTETITVGDRSVINVVLEEESSLLDELVVVAYGTVSRAHFSGAAEVISERQLMQTPTANLAQALQGQAAGLMVTNTSGAPGSDVNITIRGIGSINANTDPLILIDNVPSTMSEFTAIAPSDVTSVTVLKDAASTALYGSRAANGVILVTTRAGQRGEMRISFSGNYSVVQIQNMPRFMDGPQFAQFTNMAARHGKVNDLPFKGNIDEVPTRDLLGMMIRNGLMYQGNLQISGGSDNVTYLVSTNYRYHQGLMPNSNTSRVGLRANITADLTPKLHFTFNTTATREERQRMAGGENGAIFRLSNMTPIGIIAPGTTMNDTGYFIDPETGDWTHVSDVVPQMMSQQLFTKPFNYSATASLTYTPIKGLTLTSRGNVAYRDTQAFEYVPKMLQTNTNNATAANRQWAHRGSSTRIYWLVENFANYSLDLNDKMHRFRFMLGQSAEKTVTEGFGVTTSNFPHDYFWWHNLSAAQNPIASGDISTSTGFKTMASFWGNTSYTLLEKYTIDATLRADGSSRFGSHSKWGYFPSVGLRWNALQEEFIQNINSFSRLGVRASWGLTGNDGISQGTSRNTIASGDAIINDEYVSTSVWNQIGNESIRWEKNEMYNVGVETGFFRNAILFNVDLYQRRTSDLLYNFQLPHTTGFNQIMSNVGKVENKGIELSLTTRNIDTRNFRWTTTANVSFNKNTVLSLGENEWIQAHSSNNQISRLVVGQPMAVFVGYRTSVWQSWDEIFSVSGSPADYNIAGANPNTSITPGSIRYWGIGENGKLSESAPDDYVILGQNVPKGFASFSNTFTYKGLALTAFFTGAWGNKIMNVNASRLLRLDTGNNSYTRAFEAYRGMDVLNGDIGFAGNFGAPNWSANVTGSDSGLSRVSPITSLAQNAAVPHDYWLEDGAFLRLQSLSLAYTVPGNITQKLGLRQIQITGTASNVWTLTRYSGMDPEMASNHGMGGGFAGNTRMGWDTDAYPASITYTIDLNVRF